MVNKDEFTIKENEFSFYDDLEISFKSRNIIVINEELFIKTFSLKEGDKEVNKFILESFGEDKDYLFHTIILKNRNKVLVYVIKAGNRVDKLCRGAQNIKVTPIQFIIKNKLKKLIKKSQWTALIYILERYYLLECEEGILINSYMEESISNINEKISRLNKKDGIYIGKNIDLKRLNTNNKYYVIEDEVDINDILKKRFFTLWILY